jgi:hypothetical protein
MNEKDFQKLLDDRNQARAAHEEACDDGEACTPHGQALIARRFARLTELQHQIDAALAEASKEPQ